MVRHERIDAPDLNVDAPPSALRALEFAINGKSVLRILPLLCAVAVLWLATRHYFGVIQDARFYAVEALRELNPARYAGDLYFQFGSQGGFSLFSKLYRPLVALFGIGAAGMGVAIAGQLLWLFGLLALARVLVGDRFLWLSAAVVIAMPNIYAPYFGYGEAFATPRPFAEGLTMLALALLRSRPVWTMVLLGLSATLHPLMTLPGLIAAFVYLALGRPLWWVLAPVGAMLALVLGWAGIEPFADLHKTLDPEWLSVIRVRSVQCLLTRWPWDAYLKVLNGLAWGLIGLFALDGRNRRFLAAVFAAGLAGLVCTLVVGDIAHNVLVAELQPWRSMWLLLVVVRIFIPVMFFSLLAKGNRLSVCRFAVDRVDPGLLDYETGPAASFGRLWLLVLCAGRRRAGCDICPACMDRSKGPAYTADSLLPGGHRRPPRTVGLGPTHPLDGIPGIGATAAAGARRTSSSESLRLLGRQHGDALVQAAAVQLFLL
jgi:hypothetical protein